MFLLGYHKIRPGKANEAVIKSDKLVVQLKIAEERFHTAKRKFLDEGEDKSFDDNKKLTFFIS